MNKPLLISFFSMALLSVVGCDQSNTSPTANTEPNQPSMNSQPNVIPSAATASSPDISLSSSAMPHAAHGDHHQHAPADQPAHVKAYMDSMNTMHHAMSAGVETNNADVGFAQGMIPHHQGAVEMAKIQLQYGKDPQMRTLAEAIIKSQEAEINQMQQWLNANKANAPAAANAQEIIQAYHDSHMSDHDAMMAGILASDPDVAFVKGMIPHHQGAIEMANVEQKYGKDPAMLKLAEQIKQAQTPEIEQMQNWLKVNGH